MPVRMITWRPAPAPADAGDQRDVGDEAVHRAEDRGPQPAAGDVTVVVVALARRELRRTGELLHAASLGLLVRR
ncbi:hypothetical protein [Pseudonocardia nigra]|uniref:hypothetical protein n=1 Tax=Pseudonocardia nigra TaxID=1921578 RepID=UPI001FEC8B1D|nr:hypothetical protein [Pseudonocardia nigra]